MSARVSSRRTPARSLSGRLGTVFRIFSLKASSRCIRAWSVQLARRRGARATTMHRATIGPGRPAATPPTLTPGSTREDGIFTWLSAT